MPTKRRTGAAAVNRSGRSAGTIDSRNGSASVTPAPRRNVRRGMCFLVTNTSASLVRHVGLDSHLKLRAPDDAEDDCREAVVLPRGAVDDRADGRHVGV